MTEENAKAVRRMLALVENQAKFLAESSNEEFQRFVEDKELLSKLEDSARRNLEISLKASRKKRLFAAKEGVRKAQTAIERSKRIPSSPNERKSLFEKLLGRGDLPGDLTLAFRAKKGNLSDAEIESALEDLEMLGFFEGEPNGRKDDS